MRPRTMLFTIAALAFLASSVQAQDAQPAAKAPAAKAEPAAKVPTPDAAPAAKAPAEKAAPAAKEVKLDPKDVPEAVETGKGIFYAFKGGKYREAIAGILVLLVFLWRRFLHKWVIGKVSSWWVGFITVLLAYVASVPEALALAPFKWTAFVWSGLLTSAQAMLLWQMVGKKVLPKVFGEPKTNGDG